MTKNKINEVSISKYMDKTYPLYALYTVMQRALPEIDGFKQPQRIAMYTLLNRANNEFKNVSALGGATKEFGNLHGDASAYATITNMVHTYKNTVPLLVGKGQYGNLRNPGAGAARYIEAKVSENFHLLYADNDLLEFKMEKGKPLYPKLFYPIIPVMLLNGSIGIAVGFASKILNRSLVDIINATEKVLNGEKTNAIEPYFENLTAEWIAFDTKGSKWESKGDFKFSNKPEYDICITNLPYGVTLEQYNEYLYKLQNPPKVNGKQKNSIIEHWADNSIGDNIEILIKLSYDYNNDYSYEQIRKDFKLSKTFTENYTYIHNGKVVTATNTHDIIKDFVDWRLGIYQKRKDVIIKQTQEKIPKLTQKALFIKEIVENRLEIRNIPINDIYSKMDKLNLPHELLKISAINLTKEAYDQLIKEISGLEKYLIEIQNTTPKDLYRNDLKKLKENFKL